MGRKIRRVPPNWQHPVKEYCRHQPNCTDCYKPMYEKPYDKAAKEWMDGFAKWNAGERPKYFTEGDAKYFWDWDGMPPDEEYYNTYYAECEATWYQVYQTVSEGTPVTPPFETEKELIDYLIEHGDYWRQKDRKGGYSREAAEKFVLGDGWVPSMVMKDGILKIGIESLE